MIGREKYGEREKEPKHGTLSVTYVGIIIEWE